MRTRESCPVSGPLERVVAPARPFIAYLREFRNFLPWDGLTGVANRPFEIRAEAHLWLELVARGKNPRDYYETSFTKRGDISAPCANCDQWVFKAFEMVFTPTEKEGMKTANRESAASLDLGIDSPLNSVLDCLLNIGGKFRLRHLSPRHSRNSRSTMIGRVANKTNCPWKDCITTLAIRSCIRTVSICGAKLCHA